MELILSHYRAPICPEWEEDFMQGYNRLRSYTYDKVDFFILSGTSQKDMDIHHESSKIAVIDGQNTGLIIDPKSLYFGSVLYGVNRNTDQFFWLLGRALEEPEFLRQWIPTDWKKPYDELRLYDASEHRNIAKQLHIKHIS